MLFHPNGAASVAAIGLLFLIELRWRVWREARPWLFACGVALVMLPYWLWMHSDTLHAEAWRLAYGIHAQTTFMENLRQEIFGRYGDFIQFPFRVHVVLLLTASVGVLWVRNRRFLGWLAVAIVPYLVLWLYAYNKNVRYFAILAPFLALAVAGAVTSFQRESLRAWAIGTVLLLYGVVQVAGNGYLLYKDRRADYASLTRDLQRVVPTNTTVYGAIDLWMALRGRTYYGYERTPFDYAVERLKPAYMILNDRSMKGNFRRAGDPYANLRRQAYAFVAEHGELVGRVCYPFYGDLEVYRIHYSQ